MVFISSKEINQNFCIADTKKAVIISFIDFNLNFLIKEILLAITNLFIKLKKFCIPEEEVFQG